MDWDRIEGNWKQLKGKVKEQWASSQTTILMKSQDAATSWKAGSKNDMGLPRIKSAKILTIGTRDRIGRYPLLSAAIKLVPPNRIR